MDVLPILDARLQACLVHVFDGVAHRPRGRIGGKQALHLLLESDGYGYKTLKQNSRQVFRTLASEMAN